MNCRVIRRRGGSINLAEQQALAFNEVVDIFMGAATKDMKYFESLGHNGRTIVEETARKYYEEVDSKGRKLPVNWKDRIEEMKPHAMNRWMCRPRG